MIRKVFAGKLHLGVGNFVNFAAKSPNATKSPNSAVKKIFSRQMAPGSWSKGGESSNKTWFPAISGGGYDYYNDCDDKYLGMTIMIMMTNI